jgi:hypothetical protein
MSDTTKKSIIINQSFLSGSSKGAASSGNNKVSKRNRPKLSDEIIKPNKLKKMLLDKINAKRKAEQTSAVSSSVANNNNNNNNTNNSDNSSSNSNSINNSINNGIIITDKILQNIEERLVNNNNNTANVTANVTANATANNINMHITKKSYSDSIMQSIQYLDKYPNNNFDTININDSNINRVDSSTINFNNLAKTKPINIRNDNHFCQNGIDYSSNNSYPIRLYGIHPPVQNNGANDTKIIPDELLKSPLHVGEYGGGDGINGNTIDDFVLLETSPDHIARSAPNSSNLLHNSIKYGLYQFMNNSIEYLRKLV